VLRGHGRRGRVRLGGCGGMGFQRCPGKKIMRKNGDDGMGTYANLANVDLRFLRCEAGVFWIGRAGKSPYSERVISASCDDQ
jgi:hypothetical protein